MAGNRTPNIIVKDAELIFTPNFSGAPDKYNKDGGKRYFNWKINDSELAQKLADDGWPVRIWAPEDGDPIANMKINVSFRKIPGIRPMEVYMVKDRRAIPLDQESICDLDYVRPRPKALRMEIRPYVYDKTTGDISAYLQTGYFELPEDASGIDPFYDEFEHVSTSINEEEVPFD